MCTLCNRALRIALKEFLQHSKESRGVLGQASKQKQAGMQAGKHAGKEAGENLGGIQSEPCPVGACLVFRG